MSVRVLLQRAGAALRCSAAPSGRNLSPRAVSHQRFLVGGFSTDADTMTGSRDGLMGAGGRSSSKYRPRRVVMYAPAPDVRKTEKAAGLGVDTLVFDLEDAVAVSQKEEGRRRVRSAIARCRSVQCPSELVVRVNGVDSGMMRSDIEAIFDGTRDPSSDPEALMLPKVESVEHLREFDLSLSRHSSHLPPLPLFLMVESPLGLVNLKEICAFGVAEAERFYLSVVMLGSDDILAGMGATRTKSAVELLFARQSVVMHARAFGLDPIDLVDIDLNDLQGLQKQSEEGARMGFAGKQVIHPSQIPAVQAAFSPSPDQVMWASSLIEAFHRHQQSGKGAFIYEGKMIDRPSLLQAENTVNLQKAISEQ